MKTNRTHKTNIFLIEQLLNDYHLDNEELKQAKSLLKTLNYLLDKRTN